MSSGTSDSFPSTELVAGFEVQRQLGDRTWEAVESRLGRRVALRLLGPDEAFDATQWPDRPGVVRLFAVVEGPAGRYIATTFVPGARTLAQLCNARAARRARWVDEASRTLEGIVHGRLTAADVLVGADGRALVTGFGRAQPGATAAADQAALDALRPPERRFRRPLVAAGILAAAVAAALVLALGGEDTPQRPQRPAAAPPVTDGTIALGSALALGEVVRTDCENERPSGSSLACTIMQQALPGRPLVAASRGIVRAWAVRGASGRFALQVLRPEGDGFVAYNRSPTVRIEAGHSTTVIPADLSVPKGARFALEVAPGSAIGLRRGVRAAETIRFFGPVRSSLRRPDPAPGRGEELLLRVDMDPLP